MLRFPEPPGAVVLLGEAVLLLAGAVPLADAARLAVGAAGLELGEVDVAT